MFCQWHFPGKGKKLQRGPIIVTTPLCPISPPIAQLCYWSKYRDSTVNMVFLASFPHAHTHNISLLPNLYHMINIHSFIRQIFIEGWLYAIIKTWVIGYFKTLFLIITDDFILVSLLVNHSLIFTLGLSPIHPLIFNWF